MAPGNASSVFLIVDKETNSQTIVQSGLTTICKDEKCTKTVFNVMECDLILDTIPSIPFGIDFRIPASKVICGDLFAGVLTTMGDVFTWGWN